MTIVLVDSNNQMYRQGWVHRNLTTQDGRPTGVLYGFLEMLLSLKHRYPDARFVSVWDGPRTRELGWRFKLYGNYKNRKAQETGPGKKIDIMGQSPLVQSTMAMLGIPQVMIEGVEGDDAISILAHKGIKLSGKVVVHSSDKDFWQLLHFGVEVIAKLKDGPVTSRHVMQEFGCGLDRVIDARVLLGDSSDKIPGAVRGIGPKRGRELIQNPTAYKLLRSGNLEAFTRNELLMRLPNRVLDNRFHPKQTRLIKTMVSTVLEQLRIPVRGEYREFLAVLGDCELQEAMSSRTQLWNLQF